MNALAFLRHAMAVLSIAGGFVLATRQIMLVDTRNATPRRRARAARTIARVEVARARQSPPVRSDRYVNGRSRPGHDLSFTSGHASRP